MSWETFELIVAEGIAAHNARKGRRTAACGGVASFDDVFAASMEERAWLIRKPSPRQLAALLLQAEPVSVDRRDGSVRLAGNRYAAPELLAFGGKKVVLRVDPDALWEAASAWTMAGEFICTVGCIEKTGFADSQAARDHAAKKRAFMKAAKLALELNRPHAPNEVAALIMADAADAADAPPPPPRQKVQQLMAGLAMAPAFAPAEDEFDDLLAEATRASERLGRHSFTVIDGGRDSEAGG